jgi:hypothetical protein
MSDGKTFEWPVESVQPGQIDPQRDSPVLRAAWRDGKPLTTPPLAIEMDPDVIIVGNVGSP